MSNTPPTDQDRLLAAFRALVQAELAPLRYAGLFDYTITGVSGAAPSATISARPTDQSTGLPDINNMPCSPAVGGVTSTPTVGGQCVVAFLDHNPAKPVIVGLPSSGSLPVARLGDQVMIFLPPTLPVQGTVSGSPFVGTITITNPISGSITQGSGKVRTG